MRILLIGSGGREHAIGWKLTQSSHVDELISLPGNPGLAKLGPIVEGIDVTDVGAIAAMARLHDIDLAVVGPEAPLAGGIADALTRLGISVFGPSRAAARLESSKSFANDVMARAGVPTGHSESFDRAEDAKRHIDSNPGPYVVKADGLAGGKGVLVTESRKDAVSWVERWIDAGPVVVEEYLDGPELSVFAVCTESTVVALEPARDYKRLRDGDQGPNTGGMGSYSPVEGLPDGLVDEVLATVIHPTLNQMREEGNPFTGFLYAGLVLTSAGPKVLEFNVRLGDPETQAVLPRMTSDFIEVLSGGSVSWSDTVTVNVVLAAEGYPHAPERGAPIKGAEAIEDDVLVFQAGTVSSDGRLLVDGGRVLDVVGIGPSLETARRRAYEVVGRLAWRGAQFRTDIGL